MSVFSRFVFFCYNLVLIFIASVAIAATTGTLDVTSYWNAMLGSPENRTIVGLVALVLIILAVAMILAIFKRKPQPKSNSFDIEKTLNGSVSITDAALKVIIMRAIKQVDGVREVNTRLENSDKGLRIIVNMMINPNLSVPEMSEAIQASIKEMVEKISGLTVDLVSVIVDDFNAGRVQGGVKNV